MQPPPSGRGRLRTEAGPLPPRAKNPVCPPGWGQGGGDASGGYGHRAPARTPSHPLTVTGQEHGPVHQALQGLPEQLAGAEGGLQMQEALQHRQQVGGHRGAAHLGGVGKEYGSQPSPPQERPPCHPSMPHGGPGDAPESGLPDGHAGDTWGQVSVGGRSVPCGMCSILVSPHSKPVAPVLSCDNPRCLQMFLDASGDAGPWLRAAGFGKGSG